MWYLTARITFYFQVMGEGKVLEYGVPYKLLQKQTDGALVDMINHTASETRKKLHQMAQEAYYSKNKL